MSWIRQPVADALVSILTPIDAAITVYGAPPATFNPPVYVVWFPTTVQYNLFGFGTDEVTLPILCAAGPGEWDRVDAMVNDAKKALDLDPSLRGAVPVGTVTQQQAWRILSVALTCWPQTWF